MNPVIKVEHLRKAYGTTVAVEDVSFDVAEGEIFGLLGRNGAGKTTTVECLQGLRQPDSGQSRVLGLDPQIQTQALRRRIGCQLQESALPDRMRVWEALDLFASFVPDRTLDWRVDLHPGNRSKDNVKIDIDSHLRGGNLACERRGSPRLRSSTQ